MLITKEKIIKNLKIISLSALHIRYCSHFCSNVGLNFRT